MQDLENKKKTSAAGVAIQQTAVQRARISAQLAQRTIEGMVLKAKTAGYVNVQPNSNQNIFFSGQLLPPFQTGDTARAGQAVAQIPDMSSWEVSARILETDRAHIQPGLQVSVGVAAIPGREFKGHVKNVGSASGPAWERVFECRISLDEIAPEMRPGMTSNILVTVEALEDVLWIPAQALMESDGRSFVYVRSPEGAFTPHDVKLVRRSESQAVITGIEEGREVALSKPEQQKSAQAGCRRDESVAEMIVFSDVVQAFGNLRAQKTRTLLTALGIVFGVGSVIGMLSIGAGAREESLRFIEQLGVRNILIDSRQAMSQEEFQQRRRSSPGLTRRDVRILRTNVDAIETISARKTLHPASRASQTLAGDSGAVRRPALVCRHSQPAVRRGPLLRRNRRREQRAGLRAWRNRQGQSARLRSGVGKIRQGE